jgi:hypothetical protein
MARKPTYPPDPTKRPKAFFDLGMAAVVVLSILVLGFGVDRVLRYVTGESRAATKAGSSGGHAAVGSDISVIDGDTIR